MSNNKVTQAGFLPNDKLKDLLSTLEEFGRLLVPTKTQGNCTEFMPKGHGEMDLQSVNTRVSAKNWVFPQCSPLFKWSTPYCDTPELTAPKEVKETVLFGLRSCDAKAIKILDDLFIEDTDFDKVNKDALYKERRDKLTLVGLACPTCQPTCFCTSFEELSPVRANDCDLYLTKLAEGYLVEVSTEKGKAIVEKIKALLADGPEDMAKEKEEIGKKTEELQKHKADPKSAEGGLDKDPAFEHEYWATLSERCLGCMACTYLCPTCHCYEIRDEGPGNEGVRYRMHDACMGSEFTLHASGHNPRSKHFKRWRQRCFHKFSYFPKNLDTPLCVGCGRCTLRCPVGVDIVEILKEVASF